MHYRRARRERGRQRRVWSLLYKCCLFTWKKQSGSDQLRCVRGTFFFFPHKRGHRQTPQPSAALQLPGSVCFALPALTVLFPAAAGGCFRRKSLEKVIVRDLLSTKQQTASQHQSAPGRRSLVCVVSSSTVVSRTPEKSYSVSQTQCVKCSMPEYQDVLLHPAAFCSMFMTLNCRWRAGSQYKSNALQ